MALGLYKHLTTAFSFALKHHASRRAKRGKEDINRVGERRGNPSQARPQGELVWLHAASVGEAMSSLALVNRLLAANSQLSILVTTGTVASATIMEKILPERATHQYFPYDVSRWGRRFLDHWQPNLVLWLESEFWPNILAEVRRRGISLILINGRMSDKSFRRWQRVNAVSKQIFSGFNVCFAQSVLDAEKLKALGAPKVIFSGNIKFAAKPLQVNESDLQAVKQMVGGRPVWLAASTHEGEETLIAEAHGLIKEEIPNCLCIMVPRHPSRGDTIATQLENQGFKIAQRSLGQTIRSETDVYLADTLAELGIFYRLSPISFIGGSMVPIGGHNPIEPAQLGSAILHGIHMENCREIAQIFAEHRASYCVENQLGLADTVANLIKNPKARDRLVKSGYQVIDSQTEILDRILEEVSNSLEQSNTAYALKSS